MVSVLKHTEVHSLLYMIVVYSTFEILVFGVLCVLPSTQKFITRDLRAYSTVYKSEFKLI